RIDVDDRVLFPGTRLGRIGEAAPQIDHRLALDRRAERRADIAPARQVALELRAHRFEFVVRETLNFALGHVRPFSGRPFTGADRVASPATLQTGSPGFAGHDT